MATFRGVDAQQELKDNVNIRDTKTLSEKFSSSMKKKNFPIFFIIAFAMLMTMAPLYAEFLFLIGLLFYPFYKKEQEKFVLPFKLPETSGMLDWHQPKPGQRGTVSKAQGTVFLGNEIGTNNELWLTDSDVRQHILIFGTTGAGKAFELYESFYVKEKGWTYNKDLKEGDLIKTPFGYSKIQALFKQKNKKMCKVVFENGISKKVSKDHLWEFYTDYDYLNYEDFETFRKNQHFKITETKNLAEFLKQGKKIFIPHSSLSINEEEYELKKYCISDLTEMLIDNIKNDGFSNKNKEILEEINSFINKANLLQKDIFLQSFLDKILKNTIYLNNIIYKSKEEFKLFSQNSECLDLLHFLLTSMGYVVVKNIDINGKISMSFKKSYMLKIIDIVDLKEREDCQCIKIEDERGLVTLKENITSHNTEALLSLLTNAFIQGSGFIFVDGKADLSTFAKVFSLCRTFRREEDLLVINYMTSGQDVFGAQEKLLSNTLNPFISGSSSGLTEMMVGLMDSGGGSDPMWQGRAIALISAVMMGLVWLRDNEGLLLDIDVLREHLLLEKIAELQAREYGGVEGIAKAIRAYMQSIPGYNAEKSIKDQEPTVSEQHGYLQMQFTRILGSLSDTYGYIFRTNLGHIDFKDVVLNRRILLVLLPALEKSEPELQNLGKIVVSCIKSMMASTLGSEIDGNVRDNVENRATNALSAYYCVFDEYGYYIVKGSAVMPAQARSLGFCMVFAGQDLPSFQKNNNKEEATSIIANCNLKIFMKVEDPNETYELLKKTAGQVMVETLKGKEREIGAFVQSYYDQLSVSYERKDRVEWLDAKEQFDGEAHMIQSSGMARAKFFFVNPNMDSKLKFRPNYFIKIEPPKHDKIVDSILLTENVINSLKEKEYMEDLDTAVEKNEILSILFDFIEVNKKHGVDINDVSSGSVLLMQYRVPTVDSALNAVMKQYDILKENEKDGIPYLSPFGTNDRFIKERTLSEENVVDVFLEESTLKEKIKSTEEFFNEDPKEINQKSQLIINQLKSSANYPSPDLEMEDEYGGIEVSAIVKKLGEMLAEDSDEVDF